MPDPVSGIGGAGAPQTPPPGYAQPTGFGGGGVATMANAQPSTSGGALGAPTPYDPNNPQPYVPVTMPNVDPNVQSPLGPEQPIRDLGAASPAGRAAYIGDQLLRGYMQGKSIATARQAVQLARQQQGLSSLYNQASQQYLQLKQAGVDPNSPEMQAATNQVQSAWNAQMDLYKNHIQGMKLDDQGNPVPQKKNLLQRMFDQQNPNDVPAAWYELMQKTGPPVFHQAQVYDSPAYQARAAAAAQTRGTQAQTAQTTAETGQQQAQNQLRVQQLIAKAGQPNGLNADEQNELTTLQTGLAANGKNAGAVLNFKPVPNSVPVLNPDTKRYQMSMINERGQTRMVDMPEGFQPNANMLKGVERAEMVNGQWMKYQVNGAGQRLEGTEMPLSSQGLNPQATSTTSEHIDPATGEKYETHSTSVKGPANTGGTGAGAGTGGVKSNVTTITPPGSSAPTKVQTGDGEVVAVPSYLRSGLAKAQNTLTEATRIARVANDPQVASNGIMQETMLYNLLHSSIGRSNQTEINRMFGAAGWGASIDTWMQRAKDGQMSPELVGKIKDMVNANQRAAAQDMKDLVEQAHASKGKAAGGGTTAAPPPPPSPAGSASSNTWFQQNAVPAGAH